MRLLQLDDKKGLTLTGDLQEDIPPYAILSHTWGSDEDEPTFYDLMMGPDMRKAGYAKIRFCGEQAKKNGLHYFWVDTCCIDRKNHVELSETFTSMFSWYRGAVSCYVHLSDVSIGHGSDIQTQDTWEQDFRKSRWFTRGWTLQELLAPALVEFFSREGQWLGNKQTLEQPIHEITGIPITALRGAPLSEFSVAERMRWRANRSTKKKEDQAYCLLGIFNVFIPFIYGEGDNAFVRLKREIDRIPEIPSSEGGNVHWVVARSSNSLFTGREKTLHMLEATIRAAIWDNSAVKQYRVVISGMGGQGKSELCLQLAQRVRSLLWGIFWVNVSTPSLAENGFLDIAHHLNVSASTWEEGRLGLASTQRPWMLILDNADDPTIDYQNYFPSGTSGVVVLTTRNAAFKHYATADFVSLEGLPLEDATDLLLKATDLFAGRNQQQEHAARSVAALLQSHPLALIQAGAYVARDHCSLADYPQVYARHRKRLLKFRPVGALSRYQDVYATLEASIEILQSSDTESAEDALQLLPLLAVCGPNHFPLRIFEVAWEMAQDLPPCDPDVFEKQLTQWHSSHLPPFMYADEAMWDSFRLTEAVQALKTLGLVSTEVHEGNVNVSMHPLVHAWARDRQRPDQQHKSLIEMGCVISISCQDQEYWRVHAREVQTHLQEMTSWEMKPMFSSEPTDAVACILLECGWMLHYFRADRVLSLFLNRLCIQLGLDVSTVEVDWFHLYDLIGRNLYKSGKIRESVKLLTDMVKLKEQTMAESHHSLLGSQHELAGAFEADGQVREAIALLETVVRIREQRLTVDHPDRLASQHELARSYKTNGQVKEAIEILEKVVRIREQILSEDHPELLASQHELAGAYEANGQVKAAIKLLGKVVQIEALTLADDHPDRLASQHGLAGAYRANGQTKEAIEILETVVRIEAQTLAAENSSRLASQHELAGAYRANGQVKAAMQLLETVVEIRRRTLAEYHPDLLASLHELGGVYEVEGRVKEAIELLETVVRIESQTLAEDNTSRLKSMRLLGEVYLTDKQVQESVRLLEEVLRLIKQNLAPDHPERLTSQRALAVAYGADEKVAEGVALLQEVVEICGQTMDATHPSRLMSEYNYANLLWQHGEHENAVQLMRHVVGVRQRVLDEHHLDRVECEAKLANYESTLKAKEESKLEAEEEIKLEAKEEPLLQTGQA